MLESLHKSLVKGLDAKNLGLEKEEGYFSTNQLLRSFDEVKFQIVELQKLMKGNHDIDEDDKKASKSSVHHQLPDWKELFKAAVKSLIQAIHVDVPCHVMLKAIHVHVQGYDGYIIGPR
eukprot:1391618-Amorphochlora_amoeboformis.AAC.2